MIEFAKGSLLDADVEALVNTVNTEGVMGKGVALQFKRAYPGNYEAYRAACQHGDVRIGHMYVYDTGELHRPRWVINFPTKRHWRSKSRLGDIEAGLVDLRRVLEQLEIRSVALPALGAGLGGLRWDDVRPRIEAALADLPIRVILYPPQAPPAPTEMRDEGKPPKLTPVRAALLGLLGRFSTPEEGVTPLAVQKLLYFLEAAGEPLRLKFDRGIYGPYADAARHVVQALEGYYLVGYGDGTGERAVRLLADARSQADVILQDHPDTLERFERVAELIDGFESPYGLELLASTHWAAAHGGATNADEATEIVRSWSARKERLFTPEHVAIAWERLSDGGWLNRMPEFVGTH
jgi:O-acetyl-ADP-ribose deacetylase (regulator of RNase III)